MKKTTTIIKALCGLALCAAMLTSCASSKKASATSTSAITPSATTPTVKPSTQTADFVPTVNAHRVGNKTLSAKMDFNLEPSVTGFSIGGNFRVKRDDVIQLSLTVLGIKEVGRLELTTDSVLLLNRLNNTYTKASYAEIPYLKASGIDFYSFQALFWGELFVPNDKGAVPAQTEFTQKKVKEDVQLTHSDKNLVLTFLAAAVDGLLSSTKVTTANNTTSAITSEYSDWTTIGQGSFPKKIVLKLGTGTSTYKATIELNSLKENSDWETRTKVNTKKYRKVSVASIMKQLSTLSK